jgi:hypothetical protein
MNFDYRVQAEMIGIIKKINLENFGSNGSFAELVHIFRSNGITFSFASGNSRRKVN